MGLTRPFRAYCPEITCKEITSAVSCVSTEKFVNVISYRRGNLLVDDETLQPEVNCVQLKQ
jgi:hypothetical protein